MMIHTEVLLSIGERYSKVKETYKEKIGTFDQNTLCNTALYDVEFPDSAIK